MKIKIAISKKSLTGRKTADFGYQYDDQGRLAGSFYKKSGKLTLIDTSNLSKEVEVEVLDEEAPQVSEKAGGKIGAVTKKVKQLVVDEKVRKQLEPILQTLPLVAPLDPGFVDPKTFGPPKAMGRVKFASIDETSDAVKKFRELGLTDVQLREGFLLHDPNSYPALEVIVI